MDPPRCYLPARTDVPTASRDPRLAALAASLSCDFADAARELDDDNCSPSAVAAHSLRLADRVQHAITLATLASEHPKSAETPKIALSDVLTHEHLKLQSADLLEPLLSVFERYDNYFNIQRYVGNSPDTLFAQLLETLLAVLPDFPRCLVDAMEFSAILNAVAAAMNPAFGSVEGASGISSIAHGKSAAPRFSEEPSRIEALYRWKVGHHLFNLLTIHATERLLHCLAHGDVDRCSRALRQAATLLRGTTAAMWYAEAFPRGLYATYIRPTMTDVCGNDAGFSGTDNLEFRLFKAAVLSVFGYLEATFGSSADWPQDLWTAAYDFCDTRQLDLEHHTLLAEKVVGRQPSLKHMQLMHRAGTPEAANDRPAIEALRELAIEARNFKERQMF